MFKKTRLLFKNIFYFILEYQILDMIVFTINLVVTLLWFS